MSIEVTRKTIEPMHVVSVRKRITAAEIPKTIGGTYARIREYMADKNIEAASAPLVVYHGECPHDNVDIEPAIPVAAPIDVPEDMTCRQLPKENVISVMHKGPYSTLHEAYKKIDEYMKANGLECGATMREVYLNKPEEEKPEDLLTEIQYPVD